MSRPAMKNLENPYRVLALTYGFVQYFFMSL